MKSSDYGLFQRLVRVVRVTDMHQLRADMAVAGTLGVVGDVICQRVIEKSQQGSSTEPPMDARRTSAICVFNTMYCGGCLHFLFRFYPPIVYAAARRLPAGTALRQRLLSEGTTAHAAGCAIVDNIHCALIYTPAFFLAVGPLQGNSFATSLSTLRAEWWNTYMGCCGFWVPFMLVSFSYIPATRRVYAMNAANLAWCVFIDFIAHRGAHRAPEE